MMRWMILGLAAVVLAVVGTVVLCCRPAQASCPTYVAQIDASVAVAAPLAA